MIIGALLDGVEVLNSGITNEIEITGISMNSRVVRPNDIFICISGFKTDGHMYAKEAEQRGAACILSERDIPGINVPVVKVPDSRAAMAVISSNFYGRPSEKLNLVGVTGTNGKTTVTYLVKSILERSGKRVGLIGTNRNMIGQRVIPSNHTTPDSPELQALLANMAEERCEYVIMEVSSHSLEQSRVASCHFKVAAFTNITQDHLDFHGSMKNYLSAKAKLFNMCDMGIINIDDEGGKQIVAGARCPALTYGMSEGAELRAEDIHLGADSVSFTVNGERIKVGIPGGFTVYNALTAIGICLELGIPMGKIAEALTLAEGVSGRVEVVPTGRDYTLLIDYAHTPDGLFNVLTSINGFKKGRLVALFGCGGDRDRTKRRIMGRIAGEHADFCIITSDNPRSEEPSLIIREIEEGMRETKCEYVVIENRREAIEYALKNAREKDTILLAGKGHERYQILKDGTIDFDEREIIREILS